MRAAWFEDLHKVLQTENGRISAAVEIDGQLFEHNVSLRMPSASLIKIPILLTAYRESERGSLHLDRPIQVPASSRAGGAGVIQALSDGITLTVKDLLTLMIIVSDNTAANICIDLLGMRAINRTIDELGLSQTLLGRKMMDWAAITEGRNNYTSAGDMLLCLKAITAGHYLSEESRNEILSILEKQQFQDKLPALMDLNRVRAANKTGELPGVEHDCAIIRFKDRTAYAAILIEGLRNKIKGKKIISNIGKIIYDDLTKR